MPNNERTGVMGPEYAGKWTYTYDPNVPGSNIGKMTKVESYPPEGVAYDENEVRQERGPADVLIDTAERLGEEYLDHLDRAHNILADAGRDLGYNRQMFVYDAAHAVVMPVLRIMLSSSASLVRITKEL